MKKIVLKRVDQKKQKDVFNSFIKFLESNPREIATMTSVFGYMSTHAIRNWILKKKIPRREVERVEKYIHKKSKIGRSAV